LVIQYKNSFTKCQTSKLESKNYKQATPYVIPSPAITGISGIGSNFILPFGSWLTHPSPNANAYMFQRKMQCSPIVNVNLLKPFNALADNPPAPGQVSFLGTRASMRWSCCSTASRSAGSCTTSCCGTATLLLTTSGLGQRNWLTALSRWPSMYDAAEQRRRNADGPAVPAGVAVAAPPPLAPA
jgi:hypothetical protein